MSFRLPPHAPSHATTSSWTIQLRQLLTHAVAHLRLPSTTAPNGLQ